MLSHPVLRLIITAALVLGLWHVIDTRRVADLMAELRWPFVLAGLALVQAQIVLSALRWRLTAACLGQRFGRSHAIREYYLASLLNQILPGGVSGDVVRAGRGVAGWPTTAWRASVGATVLERLAGQLMLFVMIVIGLALSTALGQPLLAAAWINTVAVIGVVLGLAMVTAFAARRRAFAPRIRAIGQAVQAAWLAPDVVVAQLVYSTLIVASSLAVFALASQAVGAPLGLLSTITLVPMALLTMLLPISIAGWGLRETAAAALWPLAGASAADGVAASIIYGLISLAGAAPGLWVAWAGPGSRQHIVRRA